MIPVRIRAEGHGCPNPISLLLSLIGPQTSDIGPGTPYIFDRPATDIKVSFPSGVGSKSTHAIHLDRTSTKLSTLISETNLSVPELDTIVLTYTMDGKSLTKTLKFFRTPRAKNYSSFMAGLIAKLRTPGLQIYSHAKIVSPGEALMLIDPAIETLLPMFSFVWNPENAHPDCKEMTATYLESVSVSYENANRLQLSPSVQFHVSIDTFKKRRCGASNTTGHSHAHRRMYVVENVPERTRLELSKLGIPVYTDPDNRYIYLDDIQSYDVALFLMSK
jgi:hypothetical protein